MFVHGFQEEVGDLWQETLRHPFVRSLADGTLEKEAFHFYLLQDDYYLSHFEKVIEKSVTQAGTEELAGEMRQVQGRLRQSELLMREQFYPRVGLTERDFSERKPAPTAYNYTSHLYRMADFGSFGVTIAALLPCYALYADMGKMYEGARSSEPFYQELLDSYVDENYQKVVLQQKRLVEQAASMADARELSLMKHAFQISVEMEWAFFDMAYKKQNWRGSVNYV
ncbi:tena/thi-4 family [Listeria marthii FSL S4-120]|uniref:Aminopyrimidine aminohydrolase n=1 Tax=Listeria marthii FSL S4-120 TaxID=702457 RepID=A0ABN0C0E5_9LIST|nr:tena/thi-4 family [Listeria marthii FSL S4-120]